MGPVRLSSNLDLTKVTGVGKVLDQKASSIATALRLLERLVGETSAPSLTLVRNLNIRGFLAKIN